MPKSFVTGTCERFNEERTIAVELLPILIAGKNSVGYKKGNNLCPDSNNCTFTDEFDRCSLYRLAPEHP